MRAKNIRAENIRTEHIRAENIRVGNIRAKHINAKMIRAKRHLRETNPRETYPQTYPREQKSARTKSVWNIYRARKIREIKDPREKRPVRGILAQEFRAGNICVNRLRAEKTAREK